MGFWSLGRPAPGRRDSFEEQVEPFLGRLYDIALRLTRDAARAEDLLQETLTKAFRTFARFRTGEPLLPWLVTILRNTLRDEVRSARYRRETPWREELDEQLAAVGPGEDAFSRLSRQELGQLLGELLARLPERYLLPVLLVDVHELSYEEAASALGVPIGTIRSRVARGRAQLRLLVLQEPELAAREPRTSRREE
ncbi:MAG: RNA polymerase sigma factor [Myxococcota bacterium]|nr:RNA polymerase sigma factor [Myxococcota bacterium]